MEHKLTNSGPLRESADKHSIYTIKRWQPQTPAMAVGLTDRVWSLRDVLMYRVPPWPQLQTQ
jgi:hypothetical protein